MEANNSLLSLFLSRRVDHTLSPGIPAFDSRHIFRIYFVRQINLLQWFSLIAITILLLQKLAKAMDLRRKGNRLPGPPCQSFYGQLLLLAGGNPDEYLTGSQIIASEHVGKTPNGQYC